MVLHAPCWPSIGNRTQRITSSIGQVLSTSAVAIWATLFCVQKQTVLQVRGGQQALKGRNRSAFHSGVIQTASEPFAACGISRAPSCQFTANAGRSERKTEGVAAGFAKEAEGMRAMRTRKSMRVPRCDIHSWLRQHGGGRRTRTPLCAPKRDKRFFKGYAKWIQKSIQYEHRGSAKPHVSGRDQPRSKSTAGGRSAVSVINSVSSGNGGVSVCLKRGET